MAFRKGSVLDFQRNGEFSTAREVYKVITLLELTRTQSEPECDSSARPAEQSTHCAQSFEVEPNVVIDSRHFLKFTVPSGSYINGMDIIIARDEVLGLLITGFASKLG